MTITKALPESAHYAEAQHAFQLAYDQARQAPTFLPYLSAVLLLCPRGGRTCQAGIGAGHEAIWLSLHNVRAEAVDVCAERVAQARAANICLEGGATFRQRNPLRLYEGNRHYHVIHHQNVIERLDTVWQHSLLAQQVACANWVVFLVSRRRESETGGTAQDRGSLSAQEKWQEKLRPFDVALLLDGADIAPQLAGSLLCILRGQPVDAALRDRMLFPFESGLPMPWFPGAPYPCTTAPQTPSGIPSLVRA